ncbi:MAG: putative collagen-binding protein, partial [Actinomycetia bacterium]|nr:putative collagen-binding protein [Actinomycetes bacterium]
MLKVHLEPAQATVTPGTGLMLTVVVTNDGDVERTCRVRVVGLEAPWVEHSDGELTVPVGSRLEVPIRVTLPLGFPRGETLVGFEVQADGGEPPMVVDTRLAVSDLESLNIGLSPVTVRGGWKGKFRLNIENRGTDPLTIKLTGRGVGPEETKSDLDFTFKPDSITLRPGERVKTRGSVSGKRHVFGNPRRRALTVTAQGETAPRHVQGAFVQRPLMPRNVLRIVGLVLVLAMWAGGLTAGVNLTSGKGKSSAQDASAQIDPNAAGPAGTDGTAAGGASGAGSEEAVVPAAGGAIAGQVKGPTDASGIKVKLRPVALADDLSTDLAAQTVSFVSSSTEDAPKESAQTLRREPTGPIGPTATTTTDAEGKWAFGGLKTPANYEVTFSKAGFAERTYVVSVDDQAPTVALEVPMVPGNGSLSGTVKGPNGPLGGAVVTVTDGTVTFRATTPDSGDDAGKWSIDGLTTPANYMVSASLRGYGTESTSLALDSGGSQDGVDLTMIAGVGSISGHITGAGVKLGNITVTATNGDVTRTASTLTEGDAGAFSLPQLPIPGDYTVSVTGTGWIPQTMALALKGNASKVDLDLVKTTATIIGTVKDAAGAPLASTGVTLAADKPIVKTLSAIDPAGTYELTGLAPGTYTLSFDRANFKSSSTIVTVGAGDRKTVDASMTAEVGDKIPKDAVVRGIVRSSTTGNPIAGVQVSTGEVSATSTATATATTTATTDATGAFVLDKLAPGSYDLKFTSGHYQPLTRTLRIGAKSDSTIDVTMLILGGVQGLVTDLTATPISNVTVTVTNDPAATGQAAFNATTTTNSSGQYSLLEQLPTGKYVATFTRAGYATRSRNFEAAAGTVAVGDIQLIELARIHGTIQTADSGTTGGFAALNGVHLLVEKLNGSTWSTVQDLPSVNGEYMITDLQPGDYRVTADKSGFGSSTKLLDDLQLREERDGGLILTPGAQTITGRATFQDGAVLAPVVGATVSTSAVVGFDTLTVFPFLRPRTSTLSTTTDASGDWTLSGQLAGTSSSYSIAKTGFTTATLSLSPPIVAGAADYTLVPNPRNVTGTLSLIGVANPVTALPGVNINVAGGTFNATVHPDSAGNYSFTDLPVRSAYTLTISATGYHNTVTVIAVPSGDHAVAVVLSPLTLTQHSSFTPRVKTGAGVDLPGVDITVGSGSPVQSDSNGQHAYTQQQPGTYTLTFHKTGYYDVTRTFTVAAGIDATDLNTAALAVTLLRLPAISVTVNGLLGAARTPLNAATVTARAIVAGVPGATSTATATANTYKLSGLDVGIYRVTIATTGYDTLVLPDITLAADDDNIANVTAPVDLLQWSPLKLHLQSRFGATTDLDGVASNVHAIRTNLPGVTATPTNQAN